MESHVYEQFNELENQHWWFKARRAYLERLIGGIFPQGQANKSLEFCEIGCGTGGNLALLSKFAVVDAIEMNENARNAVQAKNIEGLRSVNAGYLPDNLSLKQEYDGVFALDVIEHVEADAAAVKAICRTVGDDGYFISTVPAYQWLWSPHDVANHHKRRYTLKQYTNLLEQSGFKIQYKSYFNTLLFGLAVVDRLLSKNAKKDEPASLSLPSKPVNSILEFVFRLERLWAGKFSMPFGLSIVIVAQKQV